MIKVKRCLFAFFCTSVLPPCTLPFLVQKLQLKNQKNCHAQMSDFSKLLLHPHVLIWLDPFKIIIEIGDTKIPTAWYCVIQHDLPFSSSCISKFLIISPDLPAALVTPSLIDTCLPSHLLSAWVRLATHPNCRKLCRCLVSSSRGRHIHIFTR